MNIKPFLNTLVNIILAITIVFTAFQCTEKKSEDKTNTTPQIFTSKINGGDWNDPNTWIEGKVPTKNSDVNITGTVTVKDKAECLNLIIDKGAYLKVNENAILKINHHVIQEGTILNNGEIWLQNKKVK
jgi:hypothetical protein